MFDALTLWLSMHAGFIVIVGSITFALLAATLFATPWLLAQLPFDYFLIKPPNAPSSVLGTIISVVRTIAGTLVVFVSFAIMLTPGPGLILLVFGLALCDFPGKHNLLIKLVSQPNVLSALNWIRKKSNKPPFIVTPIS